MALDSRDGQIYPEVVIGSQTWLAANMNYKSGTGSYCYMNDSANCATYGRLYAYGKSGRGPACPTGVATRDRQRMDDAGNDARHG